ncbi:ABC transporter permease [soil metagenome]
MNDLKFAIRQLLKSPGFSLLAVLTLALGIGVNTAIFSLMHDLFLRGLPFNEPARLVRMYGEAKERDLDNLPFSIPRFWHYRDAQNVFTEVAADAGTGFIMTGRGEPVQLFGANVTANYFNMLGVQPIKGRDFLPQEEMTADVALVTESFWRNRLNSDPAVLGHTITLNGVPTTIIGVLPKLPIQWFGPNSEVFTVKPFDFPGAPKERLMRGMSFMRAIGRLKPGVTIEQAQASMSTVAQGYKQARPDAADSTWDTVLVALQEDVTQNLRAAFLTLLCSVAAVLLIACSNVANLLLVRFSGRRREIALRMALGAARSGIVRLFVLESTIVSVTAGIFGLALALWTVSLVPKLVGENLPLPTDVTLHWPVLAFTMGLSIVTGLLMGLFPAWQSSRADLVDGLKEGGRAVAGSAGQQRLRRGLVAAQVGLSVVLLAGAAMLISSFTKLSQQATGFNPKGVWAGAIGMPPAQYPDPGARERFVVRLLEELRASPGVESVSASDSLPLTGNNSRGPYTSADGEPLPFNQRPLGLTRSISSGYFRTMGIPLLAGRDFDERDQLGKPEVVILSRSSAKKLYGEESPLGRRLLMTGGAGTDTPVEIVGVVGDVRSQELAEATEIEFYRPWGQRTLPFVALAVRTATKPEATLGIVRAALNRVDNTLPIIQPNTMETIIANSLGQQRLTMALLGGFAVIALVLAVVGIYGAVAYTVEQRTGEIGVRLALGAQAADVLRLVVRQGMTPVIIGLAIGLAATFAVGRLLSSQLYEISPYNPLLLSLTAVTLAVVAMIACLIPARRATLVNPISALRAD